jgi:PAS domain S-box-containing protein
VLGTAFLFIGIIDLLHTLAYKGMNIFPGYDANLPAQLWIMARYMEAVALLSAPFFLKRLVRYSLTLTGYFTATMLLLLSLFALRIFPDCYIEGQGLTPFKKISEYVISSILAGSIILLLTRRETLSKPVLRFMVAATALTIASEISFTLYISVYGISNLIGHLLKILSFFFIYKSVVETGFSKPFELLLNDLKQKELKAAEERERAEQYLDIAEVMLLALDVEGRVTMINRKGCSILGYCGEKIIGKNWFETFLPAKSRPAAEMVFKKMVAQGEKQYEYAENRVRTKDGETRIIAWYTVAVRDKDSAVMGTLNSGDDITERKMAQAAREKLIQSLKSALSKAQTISGIL